MSGGRAGGANALRRLMVLGFCLMLLASACAQIPRTGPVMEGDGAAVGSQPFQPIIANPAQGATPEQIVRGFLRAMVGTVDEYRGARQYLTRERAGSWEPRRRVVIHGGAAQVHMKPGTDVPSGAEVSAASGTVVAAHSASLDENGTYSTAAAGSRFVMDITLVRESGEWRIAQVDDVILLSTQDFRFTHRSYPVYYLTLDAAFLVPVKRWLPPGGGLATRLVEQVLRGPQDWMRPALRTASPEGTRLAPPASVIVEGNTALVELTSAVREASPEDRIRLEAQLRETLRAVVDVAEVEIRVDGGRLDLSGSAATPRPHAAPAGDPVLTTGGRVVRYDGQVRPAEGLPALDGLGATHPAIELGGGGTVAVLTDDRSSLRVLTPGQGVPEPTLTGTDLTPPSIDRFGWVWSTAAVPSTRVSAVSGDGRRAEVRADWLGGRRVEAVRISLDGAAAAVISAGEDEAPRLDIAAVRRDGDTPTDLLRWEGGLPRDLTDDVLAVAWVAPWELVVLERTSAGAARVIDLSLDGPSITAPTPPAGVRTLAARGLGVGSLLLGTLDGTVYTREGAVWLPVRALDGARYPAYPG